MTNTPATPATPATPDVPDTWMARAIARRLAEQAGAPQASGARFNSVI